MPIKGLNAHLERLSKMTGPGAVAAVNRGLFAAGEEIQVEAQLSITNGAVSGAGHVPSAPGEPPNNDTGVLAGNIETTQEKPLEVKVSSNAPYSGSLEFGDSKIAERPFMRPARDRKQQRAAELVSDSLSAFIRKTKSTRKD